MSYTQLTREQRYQIYALMKEGHNQTEIAANIGYHKSTISRELSRNRGLKGYRPYQADELAYDRQCEAYRSRISWQTWQLVERLLQQQWSPEQIAGRLKLANQPTVSHECIYLYVYANKRRGGTLHQHLRSQKKQRKRYSGYIRRGQIPNRISIDKRPKIVTRKGRFGDWEADTIVGARHKGGILSMVERKSKLTRLRKLATKAAEEMRQTTAGPVNGHWPLRSIPSQSTTAKSFASTNRSPPACKHVSISRILMPVGNVASMRILTVSYASTFPRSMNLPGSQTKTCNRWKTY